MADDRLLYTGPVINTEMLVVMLERHGIAATERLLPGQTDDADDLNRLAEVFVRESDFDRAHDLFICENPVSMRHPTFAKVAHFSRDQAVAEAQLRSAHLNHVFSSRPAAPPHQGATGRD